ncbi:MAG: polysaccharide export protein [Rhodospirillales bacterium]|nr:polysaccharide export protein [Rhodospirillales bacterium]MCB9965620.1 polysaccharide export protein [Rhodospirillales bacterium]MCB9973043.1 polysaccharide export protein [Rhodospirillales bacterium]
MPDSQSVSGGPAAADGKGADRLYKLSPGDSISVSVYGEKDLSGTFNINGDGAVSFPLIGIVRLENLNAYEAQLLLEQKLKEGYLRDPSVSVEIMDYRPFSVLGEVNSAGNYKFSEGLVVADAIALAGGFTYRAQRDQFEVLRRSESGWQRVFIGVGDSVYPGDVLYVRERLF